MADQWNNTAHNVLCGIIYYVLRIYSLFAKAIRFGNQLQSSPNEERPPKECRQRSAEEAPSWRADFSGARFRTCIYMSNASCDRVASLSYFFACTLPLLPCYLLPQHPLLVLLARQTFHLVPLGSCNLFVSTWTNIACILDKSKARQWRVGEGGGERGEREPRRVESCPTIKSIEVEAVCGVHFSCENTLNHSTHWAKQPLSFLPPLCAPSSLHSPGKSDCRRPQTLIACPAQSADNWANQTSCKLPQLSLTHRPRRLLYPSPPPSPFSLHILLPSFVCCKNCGLFAIRCVARTDIYCRLEWQTWGIYLGTRQGGSSCRPFLLPLCWFCQKFQWFSVPLPLFACVCSFRWTCF